MIEFTGERFLPTETGEIAYEHWHRYALCLQLVRGKDVLDIACGEGYGTALLAAEAASIVGVDIDEDAVAHARGAYPGLDNVRFERGSVVDIPLADDSFDVVVSFETLEHLQQHDEMLAEFRRVLRPDGILVLSSPDKRNYSEARDYRNPFHVKELYFEELDHLLRRHFKTVEYYSQRMAAGSMILRKDGERGSRAHAYEGYLADGTSVVPGITHAGAAMYFLAICAPGEHSLPSFSPSMLFDKQIDLYREQEKKIEWARGVSGQVEERTRWAESLNEQLDECRKDVRRLNVVLVETNRERDEARRALNDMTKGFEDRGDWATSLDAELQQARQALDQLRQEFDERGKWALNLDEELRQSNQALQRLTQEFEERTAWAKSLDSELEQCRETIGRLKQQLSEREATIQARDQTIVTLRDR